MINRKLSFFFLAILLLHTTSSFAQRKPKQQADPRSKWVDSVYNRLNMEERIGQLFMAQAYSGTANYNPEKMMELIRNHQVGGLIFMQGGPIRQAILTNQYQKMAHVPLLIAMDAEYGIGMRLVDSVASFPKQMMLGAGRDSALVYQMGAAVAYQCKRLGVHVNFAPVVDVNNNPLNPVINMRSFGQDKTRVSKLSLAYTKGMQDNGVIACAKHFPGHGDTDADSHKDLPVINKSLQQLDTLELYPFRDQIRAGVKSVMIAHLEIPALETEPHVPTTLSKNTVTNLLQKKMGYKGLIFTDAMDMQGVAKFFKNGEAELRAFQAGCDMLLIVQDIPTAINKIREAIQTGQATEQELEVKVKKILAAKYDVGLQKWKPIDPENITEDLNRAVVPFRKKATAAGATLVRDENKILSKLNTRGTNIRYIGVNAGNNTAFSDALLDNTIVRAEWLPKGSSKTTALRLSNKLSPKDVNLVVIHGLNMYPARNYGLDEAQMNFIKEVQSRNDVLMVVMGNAYFMNNLCDARSAIVAYDDDTTTQRTIVDMLMKKKAFRGSLPVSVCLGSGSTPVLAATKEEVPVIPPVPYSLSKPKFVENAGVVAPEALDKLNAFLQKSVNDGAFPGCRILAAKNGQILYDTAFGFVDAAKTIPATKETIYDVASMTKVLATNLAVMKLYEDGKIALNKTLHDYLPELDATDKGKLKIKDLLLHQAGLKSWIPFYKETLDEKGQPRTDLYSNKYSANYPTQVVKDFYLLTDYKVSIWSRINDAPLENTGKYVYSDLDFYYLAAVVEKITGATIDRYVDTAFYRPLGLRSTTYNPLRRMPGTMIAPTENDQAFRHQQIQGYVHDQGAALLGGVAGHAGVFSTAGDVAVVFQMLLNYGSYNGKRYLKKETVEKFIAYNSTLSRRGLGFDKPDAKADDAGPTGNRCSGYTYGHQGFTGTCVWADPVSGVLFIFLSNRVNPSAENNLINKLNIRTVAQDDIYESLGIPVNRNRPTVKAKQVTQ